MLRVSTSITCPSIPRFVMSTRSPYRSSIRAPSADRTPCLVEGLTALQPASVGLRFVRALMLIGGRSVVEVFFEVRRSRDQPATSHAILCSFLTGRSQIVRHAARIHRRALAPACDRIIVDQQRQYAND